MSHSSRQSPWNFPSNFLFSQFDLIFPFFYSLMICPILFLSFFFLCDKDYTFLGHALDFSTPVVFLCSIFPLIYYLISSSLFHSSFFWGFRSYHGCYFIILMSLLFCFFSRGILSFLIFLELCVPLMFFLMINFSKDSDKFSSMIFMYLMNISGSIPFVIFSLGSDVSLPLFSSWLFFFCFFFMLASKVPVALGHFWLTKAHVSASGCSSMILASLLLKIGTLGLYKFHSIFIFLSSSLIVIFLSFSLFFALLLCLLMVRYFDLKFLIAVSSILHMSFMVPEILSSQTLAMQGSLYMMVGHGLVSYVLFYLITLIYENIQSRSFDSSKSLDSLSSSSFLWFSLFFFINLGFPPLLNFVSEIYSSSFFLLFSFLSGFFFFFILLLSIVFCMFLVIKVVFGKKLLFSSFSSFLWEDFSSLFFFSFLTMLPLLFF